MQLRAGFFLNLHEALNTEKDRARASADVQSSQKTLAQRLPHFSALPQGNALRSIFLRPRASCAERRLSANYSEGGARNFWSKNKFDTK